MNQPKVTPPQPAYAKRPAKSAPSGSHSVAPPDAPKTPANTLAVDDATDSATTLPQAVLERGAKDLSHTELLEILVYSRGGPKAARQCARGLMSIFESPAGIASATQEELTSVAGVGPVIAGRLMAAFELARRAREEPIARGSPLRASSEIFGAFHERMRELKKERFLIVMLDGKNRVIREDLVSEGILTASLVHPREVFSPAIRACAAGIVLVHNHPSGDPEPSPEDIEITKRLSTVGELIGIRVLDHVIIGDGRYVSFLERGLISV